MSYILLLVSERNDGEGSVFDFSERRCDFWAEEFRSNIGWNRENETVGEYVLGACSRYGFHHKWFACLRASRAAVLNRGYFYSTAQGRSEICGKRFDERFISIAKALKSWSLFWAGFGFCGPQHAADDAACGSFGLEELRESRAEA